MQEQALEYLAAPEQAEAYAGMLEGLTVAGHMLQRRYNAHLEQQRLPCLTSKASSRFGIPWPTVTVARVDVLVEVRVTVLLNGHCKRWHLLLSCERWLTMALA